MDALGDDCERCNSAGSIEHGMCQVCLADQRLPAIIVHLPIDESARDPGGFSEVEAIPTRHNELAFMRTR